MTGKNTHTYTPGTYQGLTTMHTHILVTLEQYTLLHFFTVCQGWADKTYPSKSCKHILAPAASFSTAARSPSSGSTGTPDSPFVWQLNAEQP